MTRKKIGLYTILAVILLPFLLTHLWMFVQKWPWPEVIPRSLGVRGFLYFLNPSSRSLVTLARSILLSSSVTLLTLAVCLPAAKALVDYEFPGKRFIKGLILLPVIVPILTVTMGIHMIFIKIGLANSLWGVILIHMIPGIPYGVKILINIFELHGSRLERQAGVLGARRSQIFFHITLPLILPGLITAGSMIYIISFSQYFTTVLMGGGVITTFSMQMFPFIASGDRTISTTYSFIFIVSILMVLAISEKLVKNYYEMSNSSNI